MPSKNKIYDLIIIGAGPAAITASIFGERYKLKQLMIGKQFGGRVNEALRIEDYPGFPSISGPDLVKKFKENINYLSVPFLREDVEKIERGGKYFEISTGKISYTSKTILLATGTEIKKLNIPGEDEFLSKGVAYYLENPETFKGKNVAVVGGGDSGATTCLALRHYANRVYWIYLEKTPSAGPRWLEKLSRAKNIIRISKNTLIKIEGKDKAESIVLKKKREGRKRIRVDDIFIEIGSFPSIGLARNLHLKIDKQGHIIVNNRQETSIPGIFAAGDVSSGSQHLKQIITACAEGAIAVFGIFQYLNKIKDRA